MNRTDFENMYRFVACISQGMEYFYYLKEPMLNLRKMELTSLYNSKHPNPNTKKQRWIRNKINEDLTKMAASLDVFENRCEAIIKQFDLSDDPKEQEIINILTNELSGFLNELEIKIADSPNQANLNFKK